MNNLRKSLVLGAFMVISVFAMNKTAQSTKVESAAPEYFWHICPVDISTGEYCSTTPSIFGKCTPPGPLCIYN